MAIREFNDTLPVEDRVHVRSIDVNEEHHVGADAFRELLALAIHHVPSEGPVAAFSEADHSSREAETDAIETLLAALEADRAALLAEW